jgi:thioredoxin reductase/2-polyprenyl-3-methyl-5-hydroxy-6-metoxy-1,4-benzoquinol methylase
MNESYDVLVVGGGAAGLSGAVALGRSRRSVLVVDAGEPRNSPAGHVHNFLTRDGTPPAELYAAGRAEVARYGGRVESGKVTSLSRDGELFRAEVNDRVVTARRLLVATGLHDELPDVPGLAERWGADVLHCPYCHGWEVRDKRVGILATGPGAVHQALLFRQLTPHVTVLRHTAAPFADEQSEQLGALGIPVVDGLVAQVEASAGRLTGALLADGIRVALDALIVGPRFVANADLLAPFGLVPVEVSFGGQVIATRIEADPTGATSVPGIYVAGNVADPQAQVISSASAGLMASAAINMDLIAEDTRNAVTARRSEQERMSHHHDHERAPHGEQAWDERYRSKPEIWSGNANEVLVAEATGLRPGTALDAGAGEGGDAFWLAARGWKVTAADISSVAIERAAKRASDRGLAITWLHADLARDPVPGRHDLVTAHYLHVPRSEQQTLFRHLASAVAPGGTLLVVGHDFSDMEQLPRPDLMEYGWTTEEVAAALGEGWTIETAEVRPRQALGPDGEEVTIHDAVLRARRD